MNIKNKNEFHPSKEWFNKYRIYSIDYQILDTICESTIETQISEIEDCLDDPEFIDLNFPSYSKEEIEDFIEFDYLTESTFIRNFQIFLQNEKKRLKNFQRSFSDEENEWIENNLNY